MTTLWGKLNLKDHATITVLNAPTSFEASIADLSGVTVRRKVSKGQSVQFAIAFATTQAELDAASAALTAAAEGDAILWIAYPKGTSKRYRCEFNRDSGWTVLAAAGFETVRMVAIDEDWSGLRFRRSTFVKSMTRDSTRAITAAGKARTAKTAAKTPAKAPPAQKTAAGRKAASPKTSAATSSRATKA